MHLVLLLIAFPLLEEIVFRWGVQRSIEERSEAWRGIPSNLATSLLFAAAHVPAWGWFHGVLVVLPSLVLGFVYQKTGTLWYCIVLHATFNLIGSLLDVPYKLLAYVALAGLRLQ
ncbi:MAG: JDVT-CTERM system CAAX-type protease [Glaciimonas sp.]|nr:JDVT-CTERM system CAAX-type protease [Glaciimonas sp.]